MLPAHWEHFAHGADLGVRGVGSTKAQAFEQAALALAAVVADPAEVAGEQAVEIDCEAPDDESLLASWLHEVAHAMAAHQMHFGRFDVALQGDRLHACAWGGPALDGDLEQAVAVKGTACLALRVAPARGGGWLAQTVVDCLCDDPVDASNPTRRTPVA